MKRFAVLFSVPLAAAVMMSAAVAESAADTKGNAEAGKTYAEAKCAPCHALAKDAKVSPNVKAPPFSLVAQSKLVTSREIDIWLQTAHPDMPDLLVPASARADVIAFINSLAPAK